MTKQKVIPPKPEKECQIISEFIRSVPHFSFFRNTEKGNPERQIHSLKQAPLEFQNADQQGIDNFRKYDDMRFGALFRRDDLPVNPLTPPEYIYWKISEGNDVGVFNERKVVFFYHIAEFRLRISPKMMQRFVMFAPQRLMRRNRGQEVSSGFQYPLNLVQQPLIVFDMLQKVQRHYQINRGILYRDILYVSPDEVFQITLSGKLQGLEGKIQAHGESLLSEGLQDQPGSATDVQHPRFSMIQQVIMLYHSKYYLFSALEPPVGVFLVVHLVIFFGIHDFRPIRC